LILIFSFMGLVVAVSVIRAFYVLNITDSLPFGLYAKTKPTFQADELVLFCPPLTEAINLAFDRLYIWGGGVCDGNHSPLIKKIVGKPGDKVSIGEDGIFINGRFIRNSKQKKYDGAGRAMPRLEVESYVLQEGEFIVASDYNPYSFDSRYMGSITQSSIKAGLRPVWVKF